MKYVNYIILLYSRAAENARDKCEMEGPRTWIAVFIKVLMLHQS